VWAGLIWPNVGPMAHYGKKSNEPYVPLLAGILLTRYGTFSFSRKNLLQGICQSVIVFCRLQDAFFPMRINAENLPVPYNPKNSKCEQNIFFLH
jgi:hypothetical protein